MSGSSLVEVIVHFRKCLQRKSLVYSPIYAFCKLVSSYTYHATDIPGNTGKRRHISEHCGIKSVRTCWLYTDTKVTKGKGLHFMLDLNNVIISARFVNKAGLSSNINSVVIDSYAMEPQEINIAPTTERNSIDTADGSMDKDVKETGEKRKYENSDNHEKTGRKKRRGKAGKQLRPGERYVPPPQKRNPGVSFCQEHFDETSYYFDGGLRKVQPYFYDFKTYCKGRWIGKTLLEVFSSEFRSEPLAYYHKAVKEGRIRLNDTPVDNLNIILKVLHIFIFQCCMVLIIVDLIV